MAIFTNENDFNEYLDEFISKLSDRQTLYVIMRAGYSDKEVHMFEYCIETLEYDAYYDEYTWNNDWFEGQCFIDVYKIITENDILSAFLR